ncbi:hypothetical protein [Vreelandella nanhaiensis]|uniref:hypothetical protein n=1 Tax=Vreelandella nanhaiensis TaxID=1258546 RepID=UPI001FEAC352|nr:hypothetical protein [Halomonas nanhaiensis]
MGLAKDAREGHGPEPLAFYGNFVVMEGSDMEGDVILRFSERQPFSTGSAKSRVVVALLALANERYFKVIVVCLAASRLPLCLCQRPTRYCACNAPTTLAKGMVAP